MLAMLAAGALRPDQLVALTVGLADGIQSLKAMSEPSGAAVGGIIIIDPSKA